MVKQRRTGEFRKARMQDVAMLAGVSTATVSHVLNKTGSVAKPTKLRVHAAIETLSYIPNVHARNLALGDRRPIGIMISDNGASYISELLKSIQKAASALRYEVIVASTNLGAAGYSSFRPRLPEKQVSGLSGMPVEQGDFAVERLSESGIRAAFLLIRPLNASDS